MSKQQKKPVFEIITNNTEEQINKIVKIIVDDFLRRENNNIVLSKNTEIIASNKLAEGKSKSS